MNRKLFIYGLTGILISNTPLTAADRVSGKMFATRSEVLAQNGMVATSQPLETRRALTRMGHRIELTALGMYGGYQAIFRDPDTGVYFGASESRKDGHAAGF